MSSLRSKYDSTQDNVRDSVVFLQPWSDVRTIIDEDLFCVMVNVNFSKGGLIGLLQSGKNSKVSMTSVVSSSSICTRGIRPRTQV